MHDGGHDQEPPLETARLHALPAHCLASYRHGAAELRNSIQSVDGLRAAGRRGCSALGRWADERGPAVPPEARFEVNHTQPARLFPVRAMDIHQSVAMWHWGHSGGGIALLSAVNPLACPSRLCAQTVPCNDRGMPWLARIHARRCCLRLFLEAPSRVRCQSMVCSSVALERIIDLR